jgi:hypothetical protein
MSEDEAYWIRWLQEHDIEAMTAEVIDLGDSIREGGKTGTLSDEQIVIRGRRQGELIHELLRFYEHPEYRVALADELGMTVTTLVAIDMLCLNLRQTWDGDPTTN